MSVSVSVRVDKPNFKNSSPQITAVFLKNVMTIGCGMVAGYPTILIPGLLSRNEHFLLSEDGITWMGSIGIVFIPLGCVFSGWICDFFGRRRAMQLINIPFLASWLLFRFAQDLWQIFFSLALSGLLLGFLEAPVITYIAEITEPHLRGILTASSSVSFMVGVLIQFFLGSFLTWRSAALVSSCVPIIAFNLLFLIPETPHWLIKNSKFLEAKKSLAWLRASTLEHVEAEFKSLCKTLGKTKEIWIENPEFNNNEEKPKETKISQETKKTERTHQTQNLQNNTTLKAKTARKAEAFLLKPFLRPFGLICFIFSLRHFSGMTTLQTYAVEIFLALRVPINQFHATIFLGIAELLGALAGVFLIHVTGKRVLNIMTIFLYGICFVLVGSYAHLNGITQMEMGEINQQINSNDTLQIVNNNPEQIFNVNDVRVEWMPLGILIASAFFSHVGLRVLPHMLMGEVFTNDTRSVGIGLSSGVGHLIAFLSNKLFLNVVGVFTLPVTFWFNGALSVLGTVILYCCLPETEGKTLEEISNHFAGVCSLDNKVCRSKQKLDESDLWFVQVDDGK